MALLMSTRRQSSAIVSGYWEVKEWPPRSHMHQLNAIPGADDAVLPVHSSIH